MTGLAFDTLRYTKRLREVGVPEPQAEVQAELLAEALAERLASKEDLAKVNADLKRDLENTRADLKRDIEITKAELKRDLENTKAELKRDIKELDAKIENTKAELRRDIKELELRMVIEMGVMILGGIGLLFGLMRAWPLLSAVCSPRRGDAPACPRQVMAVGCGRTSALSRASRRLLIAST
ncbi:MAG: hypothetical protein HQL96_06635 [Magnetococcales bacterium]|nr:hypothetical protein [Magnetococcales bacterium]